MSRYDPKAVLDGFTTVTKGVHSSTAPIALPRNQLAWANNIECRTDFMRPRPGWQKHPLTFRASGGDSAAVVQTHFEDAIFQGAIVFERFSQIVCMIGGHLFRIDPGSWTVTDISTVGDLNPNDKYRAWFCEAESWIIAQDGVSIPWIYDGASTVRSDTLGLGGRVQVPIGKAMCYSQGRLIVSYASGRAFVIGDIVGGDSGTAPYDFKDSVLCFTENDVINGGGSFSVPINAGLLTAFRPIAQIDTSMGQGPTQVFTTNAIFSLNLPTDRTTWQTVNFPIGTVSNVANGTTSDRGAINVNGDIWFRAPDGVRAFLVARRDFQAAWVNAPLSQEVSRALDSDDENLLGYHSAALMDNRRLETTRPYRVWNHGIVHQGLVQLDFQPVATLSERNPLPTWLGNCTGLKVLQILNGNVNGVPRCFIFALSPANKIELWEVTKKAVFDNNGAEDVPIQWSFETGAFSFQSAAYTNAPISAPGRELWSLDGGRLYVDDIEGSVTFALQWKPDQDPCWHDWHTWTVCADLNFCPEICLCNGQAQYRKFFNLPEPRVGCDVVTDKPYHIGREFQVRAVIIGRCRVKQLELIAHAQEEDVTGLCAPNEVCKVVRCVPPSDYAYLIPPAITGACCINNVCSVRTEEACEAAGGTYLGDNVPCTENACSSPPPVITGACCIDGQCSIKTREECEESGGNYLGDNVSCDNDPCAPPTPTGACCLNGKCSIETRADCERSGGTYLGDSTTCADVAGIPACMPVEPPGENPDPWPCSGYAEWNGTVITDPATLLQNVAAISPGGNDPVTYLSAFPGCLTAWCQEVWKQFIAANVPFTQARFVWINVAIEPSLKFQAISVFPDLLSPSPVGNYSSAGFMNTTLGIAYCPLIV